MNVRTDRNSKYHLRGVWISTVINLDWPSRHSSLIADDAERLAALADEWRGINASLDKIL